MRRLIEQSEIYISIGKLDGEHTATDINAHDIGNRFVDDGHGGSDGATRPRMHVGHDAHLRIARELVTAHAPDLFSCFDLDGLCIRDCCCDFSFDGFHVEFSFRADCITKEKPRH